MRRLLRALPQVLCVLLGSATAAPLGANSAGGRPAGEGFAGESAARGSFGGRSSGEAGLSENRGRRSGGRARPARSSGPSSPQGPALNDGAEFCVSGGAPVVGAPLVARDGSVHFLSADSYVHSFEADGRFRSSYTLDAAVTVGLAEREDGALLAVTARGGLYALEATGRLRFFRALGAGPLASPIDLGQGQLGVLVRPRHFLALSAWGEVRYRVPVPARQGERGPGQANFSAGPIRIGDEVWLGRGDELVALEAAWRTHSLSLPGPIRRLVVSGPAVAPTAFAWVDSTLYRIHHQLGQPKRFEAAFEHVLDVSGGEAGLAIVREVPAGYELLATDPEGHALGRLNSRLAPVGRPLRGGRLAYFPLGDRVLGLGARGEPTLWAFGTEPGVPLSGGDSLLLTVRSGHSVCGLVANLSGKSVQ